MDNNPPESILILGAGVFGLSTAHALLSSSRYDHTSITIVDPYLPSPLHTSTPATSNPRPPIPASFDVSRIIRPDYANSAYAELAFRAQTLWREGWPYASGSSSLSARAITSACSAAALTGNYAVGDCSSFGKEPIYYQQGLMVTVSSAANNLDGMYYYEGSLKNVLSLQEHQWIGGNADRIRILETPEQVSAAAGGGAENVGTIGYLNPTSGWADAGRAMEGLLSLVASQIQSRQQSGKGEVKWIHDKASRLLFTRTPSTPTGHSITGAVLSSGLDLSAELTIVAAGGWAPLLLPRSLCNRIRASGQAIAYIHVPAGEEARKVRGRPVLLDLGTGMFSIPPAKAIASDDSSTPAPSTALKVARHGWGYANKVTVQDTEPTSTDATESVQIHLPAPPLNHLPSEADHALRSFLTSHSPSLSSLPWHESRLCWYADTPSGDFLVDFVRPYGRRCFFAGGGSGHGFKFLPVIGEMAVKILEGRVEEGLESKLRDLWRWRDEVDEEEWGRGDGSRGGRKGMLLDEELRRDGVL